MFAKVCSAGALAKFSAFLHQFNCGQTNPWHALGAGAVRQFFGGFLAEGQESLLDWMIGVGDLDRWFLFLVFTMLIVLCGVLDPEISSDHAMIRVNPFGVDDAGVLETRTQRGSSCGHPQFLHPDTQRRRPSHHAQLAQLSVKTCPELHKEFSIEEKGTSVLCVQVDQAIHVH